MLKNIATLLLLIIVFGSAYAGEPIKMPDIEQKFIRLIEQFSSIYSQADNELTKSRLVTRRNEEIVRAEIPASPQNWIGTVYDMGTNSEGKAYISIKLSDTITFKTNNNTILGDDGTLIPQSSPLYAVMESLKVGDHVVFSCDVIRSTNLTESGKMTEPDYLVKFTDIKHM